MDTEPIDLSLLEKHPEMFVFDIFTPITKLKLSNFRLNHPYLDEILAFEPDKTVLKLTEPQVHINPILYIKKV